MNPNDTFNKQPPESDDDSLDTLKKSLYSRQDYFSPAKKSQNEFKKHDVEVPRNWGVGEPVQGHMLQNPAARMSFLKKIFSVSVVFFCLSIAAALYVFFGGGNVVSSNNVDITISGPVSVSGGEILPLEITVTNQNNTALETADLVIEYPEGTRQVENMTVPLKRYREALGKIPAGGSVAKKIQAVLFGESGDTKEIHISVEYRVKDSNAILPKEKLYTVAISSAPVTVTVNSVKEINANQEVELSVDVVSNASGTLQNLAISAQYPFGFTFASSEPKSSWSNSFWQLGDLKPGAKRTIKIRGTIAGQDNEDRTFRFSIGTESASNENVIGTNFLTAAQKITIRKPFIGATLSLNGDPSETYIAKAEGVIRADLALSNNLGLKITNVKVSIKPTGQIFDAGSVSVQEGFYRSSDRTIVWDQTFKSSLALFNPDDTAVLSFSFGLLPLQTIQTVKNPQMDMAVTVSGKRLNESGLSQDISTTISKTVRLASSLGLSARALYYSGPFTNTGPIPPKVNTDTSYTVVWSLTNGSNDLSNTKVTAILPSYMKWLAVTTPSSERISYNAAGGQIVWDVGDLPAGTGFSGSPRQVSFQVSLTPSTTQVNSAPLLVTEVVASGDDNFAGVTVQSALRIPVTTDLRTESSFQQGQGIVGK